MFIIIPPLYASDIIIVIDLSGSMQKTDPHNLRKIIARQIISQAAEDDKIAIITFEKKILKEIPFTSLSKSERTVLLKNFEAFKSNGPFTDIYTALSSANRFFEGNINEYNLIFFLSDGKIDLKEGTQAIADSRQNLIQNLIPELVVKNIRVYTFQFSPLSDTSLLSEISSATSGKFFAVDTAEAAKNTITELFKKYEIIKSEGMKNFIPSDKQWIDIKLDNSEGIVGEDAVITSAISEPDVLKDISIYAEVASPNDEVTTCSIQSINSSLFASSLTNTGEVGEYAILITASAINKQTGEKLSISKNFIYKVTPIPQPSIDAAKKTDIEAVTTKTAPLIAASAKTGISDKEISDKASSGKGKNIKITSPYKGIILFIFFNCILAFVIRSLYKNRDYFLSPNIEQLLNIVHRKKVNKSI